MDYDLERENFLFFYKTATVDDFAVARRNNAEKLDALLIRYAHVINLINYFYGGERKMLPVEEAVCESDCCGVVLNDQEAEALNARVRKHIECKIAAFDAAIEETNGELEIDGVSRDGAGCDEITVDSKIKVLNHQTKDAYEVEIDTIVRTPLKELLLALKTGELIHLFGVTRIVGYYSRVNNWNKSKIGELQDRHKGKYSV